MARLLAIALFSLLVLAAPAGATERLRLDPLPSVRAGKVDGTRAFIALSLDGRRLRIYVCDGTLKRDPTIAKWFRGRWDGAAPITLRASKNEVSIESVAPNGTIRGRVLLADGEHAFTARPKTNPNGLHHGHRKGFSATWIVLSKRQMRGTFVPTRPPRCRFVLVTTSSGQQQWVTVC